MKIEKIRKISNLGVFISFEWDSSVLYKNTTPGKFSDINIIYGRNYSGKTTLSRLFRSLEKEELFPEFSNSQFEVCLDDGSVISQASIKSPVFPIRVYNSDFRLENLSFLNDTSKEGNIKAFAVLGEDNVNLSTEIENLRKELGEFLQGNESGLYLKRKNALELFKAAEKRYEIENKYLERKKREKATLAPDSIKQQASLFGNVKYNVLSLEKDIEIVSAPGFQELSNEDKNRYSDLIKEEKKDFVRGIDQPWPYFADFIERGQEIVCQTLGKSGKIEELLRNALLNKWVHEGKIFHEKNELNVCAFCGSVISPERWFQLKQHFDEESELLKKKIDQLNNELLAYRASISGIRTESLNQFYSSLQKRGFEIQEELSNLRDIHIEEIDSLQKQLEDKSNNMIGNCNFSKVSNSFEKLRESVNKYNNLVERANRITYDKEKGVNKAREALRLQEVYEFLVSINYWEKEKEVERLRKDKEKLEAAVNQIEANIQSINVRITEKEEQLQDVTIGAKLVNNYLSLMEGFSIKLEPMLGSDEKQVYFRVLRNGEEARNLSEGECSIVAFCYFLARLQDVATKEKAPVVYIDDPICSLDANHVFFVYALIRAVLLKSITISQLFISTHSLDFLKFLHRLKKCVDGKNWEKSWLMIERKGEKAELIAMPKYMKNFVTEFEYLFLQIYKCANIEDTGDSNYETFYSFGNNARKFLEMYTYFKRPGAIQEVVMRDLFGEEINMYLVDRFNNELSHLHGCMERGSLPVDYSEEKKIARLIMDVIKREDEEQYNSLVKHVCG